MRKILLAVSMIAVSGFAFAAEPVAIQGTRSSVQGTAGGVAIQGNTTINASSDNATAIATGSASARNSVGSIRGGTVIKGNTDISAHATNTTAIATGRAKAENSVGTIGGE